MDIIADISSMGDLQKYLNKQMKSGKISAESIGMGQAEIETILKSEAERLKKWIEFYLSQYYSLPQFTPKLGGYKRTYGLRKSVDVTPIVNQDGSTSIDVFFNDDCIHPSVMGGEDGFTASLINYGWSWGNQRPYFDHHPGYDFVGMAVNEFMRNNKYGIQVTINARYGSEVIDYREFF